MSLPASGLAPKHNMAVLSVNDYLMKRLMEHEMVETKKYLTDEFSDAAVEFIETGKDQPFFLAVGIVKPHLAFVCP